MAPSGTLSDNPMCGDIDDESSVESEMSHSDYDTNNASIPCLDDISVASRCEFNSQSGRFSRTGSVESIETALHSVDDAPRKRNSKFPFIQNRNDEPNKSGHEGKMVMISNFTDIIVKVKDEPSSGGGLKRDNNSSGSLSSIKELLTFGSIHENSDYESLASSDEESDDEEELAEKPKYDTKNRRFVPKAKYDLASDELSSDAESSVDDSVINRILHKTDSREHIQGGKRAVHTTKHAPVRRKKTTGKKGKSITSDPLLDRFLTSTNRPQATSRVNHRHSIPANGSGGRLQAMKNHEVALDTIMNKTDSLNHVVPQATSRVNHRHSIPAPNGSGGRMQAMKNHTVALDTIMNKTDSLNHVSKEGRRHVKTRQDCRTDTKDPAAPKGRRGSAIGSKDVLMDRFLSSKVNGNQDGKRKPAKGKTFTSCDSLVRVEGKGQRVVGTRIL